MAYILEKITLENREKIIKDADCDELKQADLIYANKHHGFPEFWAIDRDRNYYLCIAPPRERPESSVRGFYMFFDGVIYDVYLENLVENKAFFKPDVKPSQELLAEITAAFAVYGRFGWGAKNRRGESKPSNAVVPEFILEG